MRWVVVVHPDVAKFLRRVPHADVGRIEAAIRQLDADPFVRDIAKMRGETNVWRRRVGSYRIFYEVYPTRHIVLVFRVERRTSTTYS